MDHGEFKTYACHEKDMKKCHFDSSPFITTFVLYSIKDVNNNKAHSMTERGINFLLSEQEPKGVWRYWSSWNPKHSKIKPDLDVISTTSFLLEINNE
ncbi:MAG: hypothetical protein ABEK36_02505, partial [Candidatus Aenigmatarchaeota archaeon]